MHDEHEPEQLQLTLGLYLALGTRILWALAILFGMFGIIMGHSVHGVMVLVVACTVWCSIKILHEGLFAGQLLQHLRTKHSQDDDESAD